MAKIDYPSMWTLYKKEGEPLGESLQDFCSRNDIPYLGFSRWHKKNIADVSIVEMSPSAPAGAFPQQVVFFSVELSNSLRITQRDISLERLLTIVHTLGDLC